MIRLTDELLRPVAAPTPALEDAEYEELDDYNDGAVVAGLATTVAAEVSAQ